MALNDYKVTLKNKSNTNWRRKLKPIYSIWLSKDGSTQNWNVKINKMEGIQAVNIERTSFESKDQAIQFIEEFMKDN